MGIILASGSANRKRILDSLGVEFTVVPSIIDEKSIQHPDPIERVKKLAGAKARDVFERHRGTVIAADTFGLLGRTELEKPASREEAIELLKRLSGKNIRFVTGICVIHPNNITAIEVREGTVKCRRLTEREIKEYVARKPVTNWAAAYNPQDDMSARIFIPQSDYEFGMEHLSLPPNVIARELANAGIIVDLTRLRR